MTCNAPHSCALSRRATLPRTVVAVVVVVDPLKALGAAETVCDLHGRALTVVGWMKRRNALAPAALAIPTEMNIEFDISWQSEEA